MGGTLLFDGRRGENGGVNDRRSTFLMSLLLSYCSLTCQTLGEVDIVGGAPFGVFIAILIDGGSLGYIYRVYYRSSDTFYSINCNQKYPNIFDLLLVFLAMLVYFLAWSLIYGYPA